MDAADLGQFLRKTFGRDVFDDKGDDDPVKRAVELLRDGAASTKRAEELKATCEGLQKQLQTERHTRAKEKRDYLKGRRDVLDELIKDVKDETCRAWLDGRDDEARWLRHQIYKLEGLKTSITVPTEEEQAG
jgi:hypothetical protein